MVGKEAQSFLTQYGFQFGAASVERFAVINGRAIVSVTAGNNKLQIAVSPTGRSVKVYKNGKELT